MKEILLYNSINSWSSSDFITAMSEVGDNDICVRINATGGDPTYGFGMIAKFKEHKGKKSVKVDGQAHSMYAYFLCYADDVEALEVAEFVIHRAAYPDWIEKNPEYFTEDMRANVERVNVFLRKAFEAKIDVVKFEALKGVKVKDIFSLEGRMDVTLTAAEAKQIGLIDRVVKITPEKTAEIDSLKSELFAQHLGVRLAAKQTESSIIKTETINKNNMTLAELKLNHPEAFAQAVALGVSQEKERVEAFLVYMEIDAPGVKAAIESGNSLNAKQMAEFGLKAMSHKSLENLAADSTDKKLTTEQVELQKTEKEKTLSDFTAQVKANLKA